MKDATTDKSSTLAAAATATAVCQHTSAVDDEPNPTVKRAWRAALLLLGAVVCVVAALPIPASAAPLSRAPDDCTPSSPRFAGNWETFEQQVRGRVTRKFGTVRWSSDRLAYAIKAGYLVELCVVAETIDGDLDFTGGQVLGPERGAEDDLASMERMPITVVGFGYSKARPSDGLPATGPQFGWTTPLVGCALGLLGLTLLGRRPMDDKPSRERRS